MKTKMDITQDLGIIRVFSKCDEETCLIVKELIQTEIPFLYERIINHSASTSLTPKLMAGMIKYFRIDYLRDYLGIYGFKPTFIIYMVAKRR